MLQIRRIVLLIQGPSPLSNQDGGKGCRQQAFQGQPFASIHGKELGWEGDHSSIDRFRLSLNRHANSAKQVEADPTMPARQQGQTDGP